MENLWPDDLLQGREKHTSDEIEVVLQTQAEGLSVITGGLVTGIVRDQSILPSRSWVFQLHPVQQPSKIAELLVVRSEDGNYPAIIETYDPQAKERFIRVGGLSALRLGLKKIFLAPMTRRIVRALAKEAKDAQRPPQALNNSTQDISSETAQVAVSNELRARPILIGGALNSENGEIFQAVLLGVSGFLSKQQLEAIVAPIGHNNLAVKPLHDNFVVTVQFVSPLKMTVTRDELQVLQAEARKALNMA